MSDAEPFSHFVVLIQHLHAPNGKPYRIAAIAHGADIGEQTLLNLLDGTTHSPRIDTARRLCRFFGIELDYFSLETEAQCRDYLLQHRMDHASTLVKDIAREASTLTLRGQQNVLAILELRQRVRSSR